MTATPTRSTTPALDEESPRQARLVANLAALFEADLPLARLLDALEDADLPELLPTRTGAPTCAITPATSPTDAPAAKPLFLHSRHDPLDEAKRLVDAVDLKDKVCFVAQGAGLGYHLRELLDRAGGDSFLLVFERNPRVLRRALECVDLSREIHKRRIAFLLTAERTALFEAVGTRTIMLSMGLGSLVHGPSLRVDGAFYAEAARAVEEYASFSRTSLNTVVINGRKTAENVTRNAAWYAAAGGISRLRDRYKGKPAIIVSAGPSLRRNKHLLAGAQDRAIIVAVQTTLKPLLEMGVEPDFVTSLDYHDICARFFEGLPPALKTELVAETKATRLVLGMHPGPVSLVGSDYADGLLREMNLDRPRLPAGATVAHLAFYLARWLGCDPILFVGQDLGFSDGLCYSPGTSYDEVWRPELSRFCTMEMKQWEQIVRERPILRRIPDVNGNPMYTEERLFTYLQQFERDFADTPRTILDCTEGGALKRGATPLPLAEALATYCAHPLPRVPGAAAPLDTSRRQEVVACLQKRAEEARNIARIGRQTLPLLQDVLAAGSDHNIANRAIARIDPLRAQMNEHGATYDLVMQLTQRTELQRFESDLKIAAEKRLSPGDKQKRQAERDVANCTAVIDAAGDFEQLMLRTIAEIQADADAHATAATDAQPTPKPTARAQLARATQAVIPPPSVIRGVA